MDPQTVFCHNSACPASGQVGKGNISVHSQKEGRYICKVCGKTFAEAKRTVFYRLRTAKDVVVLVVTLLAYGCPLQAICIAFGLDERTVLDWQARAGQHCQRVHEHLVERPRDLGQVQADEIRVKMQGGILWMAMAIQVQTRLWLGGVLSTARDMNLIVALMQKVRHSALCRPVLFCVDGCAAYVGAIRHVFREPVRSRKRTGSKRSLRRSRNESNTSGRTIRLICSLSKAWDSSLMKKWSMTTKRESSNSSTLTL